MGTITHDNYTKVCKSIIKTKIKLQKTQKIELSTQEENIYADALCVFRQNEA